MTPMLAVSCANIGVSLALMWAARRYMRAGLGMMTLASTWRTMSEDRVREIVREERSKAAAAFGAAAMAEVIGGGSAGCSDQKGAAA